jgi:hypothetical protein
MDTQYWRCSTPVAGTGETAPLLLRLSWKTALDDIIIETAGTGSDKFHAQYALSRKLIKPVAFKQYNYDENCEKVRLYSYNLMR